MNKSTDILNLTSRERGQKTAEYGALLALFESPYWLERLKVDHPELVLDRLIAEG